MKNQPTVYHITHYKAGSQWVAEVLKNCAPERVVLPKIQVSHFYQALIRPGMIYLTLYVPKYDFDVIVGSLHFPCRKFVVIRDLRDTLVSLYFSLRFSHILPTAAAHAIRDILSSVIQEQGFLYLIGQEEIPDLSKTFTLFNSKQPGEFVNTLCKAEIVSWMSIWMMYSAYIQLSWLKANNVLFIRYEDLVANEHETFERIINYCEIDVDRQHLYNVIKYNSFEVVTGRKRGQEDINAHQRKGIVGDWRNHFSPQVKEAFKNRFGDILIQTGYEYDLNW